jgi:hypothetical protein
MARSKGIAKVCIASAYARPNHDPNDSSRQQREREREREGERERREEERVTWVCFFSLFIFMEFTAQKGPFQIHLITALLHTSPKRIRPSQKKKRGGGVVVCVIPHGVEQSWQGDFLSLVRNFPWMYFSGAENRKGVEESY